MVSYRRLGAVALVVAASCSRKPGAPHAAASAAPVDSVVIGATMPLTGRDAPLGRSFRDGYELAFAEKAKSGGLRIAGRDVPVRLKLVDDGSDAARAVSLAEQLIERDHVDALLSTYGTRMVMVQSTVAEERHVPYVVSAASATDIFRRGYKYTFGLQSPTEQLAYAELRFIDHEQKAGHLPTPLRIAIAWENTPFGRDYRSGILDFATRTASRTQSYEVVMDTSFELGQKTFVPMIAALERSRPDVFLAATHLDEFLAIHQAMRSARVCVPIISYGSRGREPIARERFGIGGTVNLLAGTWWSSTIDTPSNRDFIDRFVAAYQHKPDFGEALGYESANALFAAFEQAGSTDREAVRQALEKLDIPTLLPGGRLSFPGDNGHQARMLYLVLQNQSDGTAAVVYPRELASKEGNVTRCGAATASR